MKKLIFLTVLFFSYAFSAQENNNKSLENKKSTTLKVKKNEEVKNEDIKTVVDGNKNENKVNEKAKSENFEKEIYNLITIK